MQKMGYTISVRDPESKLQFKVGKQLKEMWQEPISDLDVSRAKVTN